MILLSIALADPSHYLDLSDYTKNYTTSPLFADNFVHIGYPISVPSSQGGRIMHSDSIDMLDLKPSLLQSPYKEVEWHGRIGAGDNVLIHEEAPD